MLLSRNDQPPRRLLQVASNSGGLGDALARMVAIRETLVCDPNVDIRLFSSAYMLPLIERMKELRPFLDNGRLWICDIKDIKEWLNPQQVGIAFAERSFTPSRLSLVDDGLLTLADSVDSINGQPVIKDYCTISTEGIELPQEMLRQTAKGFIAVTTGFTAVVRSWPVAEVNKYLSWLKSEGFTPVLLGSKDTTYVDTWLPEGVDSSGCIDLRDKTTLLEAARVLEACILVVGVDNGLLHLAGSVDGPRVIAGYTTIAPQYREIYRDGDNIVVDAITPKGLDCGGCQSRFNFAFEHDFRTCLYNDLKCRESMTADAFIKASSFHLLDRGVCD